MQPYTKTNWVNDQTELSATNMNKIENQLEALTNNAINETGNIITIELTHEYEIEMEDDGTALIELDNEDLEILEPYILDIINDENKKDKLYKIKFSNEIWTLCAIESAYIDDENYSADILFTGECLTYALQCDFSINISGTYTNNSFTFDIAEVTLDMITHMSDLFNKTGDLEDLDTTDKTSLVNAINEIDGSVSAKQNIMQYSTMPTASNDNLGKIVQFVGTTDNTYTNGYFYQCVSDGQSTPTYSWNNIQVQTGGSAWDSALTKIYYYNSVNTVVSTTSLSGQSREWFQQIIDDYYAGYDVNILIKDYNEDTLLFGLKIFNNQALRGRPFYLYSDNNGMYRGNLIINYNSSTHVYTNHYISWTKLKTYATTDYVDNSIASAVGNINTVLATLTTPSNNGGGA